MRFRENKVGFIGEIRKMYHTVHTTQLGQHTHRFFGETWSLKENRTCYTVRLVRG